MRKLYSTLKASGFLSLILLPVLAISVLAQSIRLSSHDNPVVITTDIGGIVGDFIFVKATVDVPKPVSWQTLDSGLKMLPLDYLKTDTIGVFVATKVGQYRIIAWQPDTRDKPTYAIITVTDLIPIPPGPTPIPPGPTPPDPNPVPVIAKALRVAVFFESADLLKYPREQVNIFTSKEILTYLDNHCVKSNNLPDYRLFDKDPPLDKLSTSWQNVAKRPRIMIPWMIILDGEQVLFETALPKSVSDTMTLLRKYGGP